MLKLSKEGNRNNYEFILFFFVFGGGCYYLLSLYQKYFHFLINWDFIENFKGPSLFL